MAGKVDLVLRISRPQVARRDSEAGQRHEELDAAYATELGGLSGRQSAQFVELGGQKDARFLGELVGGQSQAQEQVIPAGSGNSVRSDSGNSVRFSKGDSK